MSRKAWFTVAGKAVGLGAALLMVLWILSLSGIKGDMVPNNRPASHASTEPATRLPGSAALIERLKGTNLLNGEEVHDRLGLRLDESNAEQAVASPAGDLQGFLTRNPHEPAYREDWGTPAELEYSLPENTQSYRLDEANGTWLFHPQAPVLRRYASLATNTEVCGVRFVDAQRVDYRLRTFTDLQSALADGYVVTHRHHCGTCSSLRDLAVYLERPNLATPARACARKLTAQGVKTCLMAEIGFEEPCAETWAYNALHTRRHCAATCVRHYGLWNVLTNDMDDTHTDEDGNLNPCLACDEFTSGSGFQFAAGRTRRTSGLTSAIDRPSEDMYPVDHRLYFE